MAAVCFTWVGSPRAGAADLPPPSVVLTGNKSQHEAGMPRQVRCMMDFSGILLPCTKAGIKILTEGLGGNWIHLQNEYNLEMPKDKCP